jgi:putative colanic acid biosynthesis UDP-glucose lipid carrier transferase
MFEDRSYKRTFYSAPQSVTSLVAAFLEPTIIVALYLLVALWFDEPAKSRFPSVAGEFDAKLP